jgi:hypothetical protein
MSEHRLICVDEPGASPSSLPVSGASIPPAFFTFQKEDKMSRAAQDLIELQRLAQGGAGALTQHLLREVAKTLIAPGVAYVHSGFWKT